MRYAEEEFFEEVFSGVTEDYRKRPENFRSFNYNFSDLNVKIVIPPEEGFFRLLRAFSHLKTSEPVKEDLTIFCVDSNVMNYTLPYIPFRKRLEPEKKDIPFYRKNGLFLSRSPDSRVISFLDMNRRKGIYWTGDHSKLPGYEWAAPFRTILQWFFEENDLVMIHSASVGLSNRGVLISGGGGTGKSTLAVSSLFSGLDFYGDDYVAVKKDDELKGISLFNSAKLGEESFRLFPELFRYFTERGGSGAEKRVLFFDEIFPEKLKSSVPLKCIITPEITGNQKSRIKKADQSECFRMMAPSTVFQHIGKSSNIFKFMSEITRSLPCYRLYLGRNLSYGIKMIREVIE